jgi:hypothetical protein
MKVRSHKTALFLATMLSAAASVPLVVHAETLVPGQPGADTSQGEQLRAAPYMIMVFTRDGMMTERQIMPSAASELMKHATPLNGSVVLMHQGKAYLIENMKMKDGRSLSDVISIPLAQIY